MKAMKRDFLASGSASSVIAVGFFLRRGFFFGVVVSSMLVGFGVVVGCAVSSFSSEEGLSSGDPSSSSEGKVGRAAISALRMRFLGRGALLLGSFVGRLRFNVLETCAADGSGCAAILSVLVDDTDAL